MYLAASLDIGIAGEVGFVNVGLGVCGEGVRDEIALCRVDNQDGRVGTHEQIEILAIGTEGRHRSNDDGEDSGRLEGSESHLQTAEDWTQPTFVCQTAMEVAVMTANSDPLREVRSARTGSFRGNFTASGICVDAKAAESGWSGSPRSTD